MTYDPYQTYATLAGIPASIIRFRRPLTTLISRSRRIGRTLCLLLDCNRPDYQEVPRHSLLQQLAAQQAANKSLPNNWRHSRSRLSSPRSDCSLRF